MEPERVIAPLCPGCRRNLATVDYRRHCDKKKYCTWVVCECGQTIETRLQGRSFRPSKK